MPGSPAISGSFGDLLDPRFQRMFNERFREIPDMLPMFFSRPEGGAPTTDTMRWSQVGAFGDWVQFTGTVNYDGIAQGYDTIATHVEFTNGFQVERKLFDDDLFHIMDQRPKGLATAVARTRQKHGARLFNMAFSVDTMFAVNTEGVPLCSDSHTTTATGVSTASGFDNKITASLSATAVAAARIQFRNFVDDRGNRMTFTPDTLVYSVDNYEIAEEIIQSDGKVDTDLNNINVHKGKYKGVDWEYLTDSNNWFMLDSTQRKDSVFWVDRVTPEFAYVEDFDSLVAKWRGYGRWSWAWLDWRFILGAEVA